MSVETYRSACQPSCARRLDVEPDCRRRTALRPARVRKSGVMVVDRGVRLDQPDASRHRDAAEASRGSGTRLGLDEGVRRPVGERGHVDACVDQVFDDRDVLVDRRRGSSPTSWRGKRGSGRPCSGWSAISRSSASRQLRPRSCSRFQSWVQTSARKRRALVVVRDQPAVRALRRLSDEHLAEVEDDMPDVVHAARLVALLVAPGSAASIAFFMTLGSASPGSASAGDHQHPGRRFFHRGRPRAQYTVSSSRKCVKTWTTVPDVAPVCAGKGASADAAMALHPLVHSLPGTSRHAAEQAVVRSRRRSSTAPSARTATKAAPCRVGRSAFAARTGKSSCRPSARATQALAPAGRASRRAASACRSPRRDPSSPGRSRRRARAGVSRAWMRADRPSSPRAAASRSRRAARSPARRCRRPPRPARRRRSPRSPPRCSRRCRAAPAGLGRLRETARRDRAATTSAQAFRLRARA